MLWSDTGTSKPHPFPGDHERRTASLTPSMEPQPSAPPVVAVVVANEPGDWFEEALVALGSQDYPNQSVLVMDAGGDADSARRVASVLPDAYLRRVPTRPGFAAAANDVLQTVQGASFLVFCHDDVAMEPDAIRLLVEEALRSNAGIVAPKVVEWDHPDRLLEVGLVVDKTGACASVVDRGELDQEQHDAVKDVFAVSSTCLLVRSDLFSELGGFDPEMGDHGADVDLCWRAQVAGARVLVAPEAVVRHHNGGAPPPRGPPRQGGGPDPPPPAHHVQELLVPHPAAGRAPGRGRHPGGDDRRPLLPPVGRGPPAGGGLVLEPAPAQPAAAPAQGRPPQPQRARQRGPPAPGAGQRPPHQLPPTPAPRRGTGPGPGHGRPGAGGVGVAGSGPGRGRPPRPGHAGLPHRQPGPDHRTPAGGGPVRPLPPAVHPAHPLRRRLAHHRPGLLVVGAADVRPPRLRRHGAARRRRAAPEAAGAGGMADRRRGGVAGRPPPGLGPGPPGGRDRLRHRRPALQLPGPGPVGRTAGLRRRPLAAGRRCSASPAWPPSGATTRRPPDWRDILVARAGPGGGGRLRPVHRPGPAGGRARPAARLAGRRASPRRPRPRSSAPWGRCWWPSSSSCRGRSSCSCPAGGRRSPACPACRRCSPAWASCCASRSGPWAPRPSAGPCWWWPPSPSCWAATGASPGPSACGSWP